MTDTLTQQALGHLRQCLLPRPAQDGIDLEVPSWVVRKAAEALENAVALEQRVEGLERELDLYIQLATFKDAKMISVAHVPDYGLAIYTLRDLPLTKEFELHDLAWAHHNEGNTSKSDWEYFRDEWLRLWREALAEEEA